MRLGKRRLNQSEKQSDSETGGAKKGIFAGRKWKIVLGVMAMLMLLLGMAAIFVYLIFRQTVGVEIAAEQNSLSSLRSLPYATWTEEDVDSSKSGVVKYEESKAFAGYNIYTNDVDQVFIMDMKGQHVHSWSLPGNFHCEFAELLKDGQILVICEGQSIIKLDWSGEVLWEWAGQVNHDVAVLPDGSSMVPVRERLRPYNAVPAVIFDSIVHLSAEGRQIDIWSTFDQLEELQKHHQPLTLDEPMRKLDVALMITII